MIGSKNKSTLIIICVAVLILFGAIAFTGLAGKSIPDDQATKKAVEKSSKIKQKITKEEAIEIVKKKMVSKEDGEILSVKLLVEHEIPCWFISYIDRDPEGPGSAWGTGAYIDAVTGEDITENFY